MVVVSSVAPPVGSSVGSLVGKMVGRVVAGRAVVDTDKKILKDCSHSRSKQLLTLCFIWVVKLHCGYRYQSDTSCKYRQKKKRHFALEKDEKFCHLEEIKCCLVIQKLNV